MLCLVDLETTGLDPDRDAILEIAMILVEDDLTVVQEMPAMQAVPPLAAKLRMDEFVSHMHRQSGLMEDIRVSGMRLADVHGATSAWVKDWVPSDTPLAGSSVHFDRSFLRAWMPDVEEYFHYRNVDASSIRELAQRWVPRLSEIEPKSHKHHRAMPDCYDSLNLLKFYKEHLFTRPK